MGFDQIGAKISFKDVGVTACLDKAVNGGPRVMSEAEKDAQPQRLRVLTTSARKTPLRSARFEAEIALLPF